LLLLPPPPTNERKKREKKKALKRRMGKYVSYFLFLPAGRREKEKGKKGEDGERDSFRYFFIQSLIYGASERGGKKKGEERRGR